MASDECTRGSPSLMLDQIKYRGQRIVVAPLNWGLGHAVRCIPIIHHLLALDNTIAIASDGEALDLLRVEFPDLPTFKLTSYDITYSHNSMLINMATQAPTILRAIRKEQEEADRISRSWQADIIISDNRLGFRTDGVKNVYMSHQLKIPSPNKFISAIASKLHKTFINKFDLCWIPDFKGPKAIAGDMSKAKINIPAIYLGSLSRFEKSDIRIKYDLSAVLSGPEPQRTKLEAELIKYFNAQPDKRFCLVRGSNIYKSLQKPAKHIQVYNLLGSQALNTIINQSDRILCRSGYTSIMDLVKLEKKATFIPTPGQYEQEYLGDFLDGKYGFNTVKSLDQLKRS